MHDRKDVHTANYRAARYPPLAEGSPKDSIPIPKQSPSSKLPCSEKRVDLEQAGTFAAGVRICYQPKSQVTRTGRVTQVPDNIKFKESIQTNIVLQMKLLLIDTGFRTYTHETVFWFLLSFDRHLLIKGPPSSKSHCDRLFLF